MTVPILGQPKGEPVTLDHEVFGEIRDALTELFRRTELLVHGQIALTQVLVDKGLIDQEEEAQDDADPQA